MLFGRIVAICLLWISCFLAAPNTIYAAGHEEQPVTTLSAETDTISASHNAEFNPGKLIIGHIMDAHEWHLWGSEEQPFSIPLPVILYNKVHGFSCFISSRFQHGTSIYNGYKMEEGKIISVDGTTFYNFSITKNVLAVFVSVALLLLIFISVANAYSKKGNKAPSGFQSAIEPIIVFIRDDVAKAAIGEKNCERFMPYLLTIFFFIWINNLLGLVPIFPGGANVTGNISVTLTLASFTLVLMLVNGNKNYWRHIFAMPGVPIFVLPIVSLLEFIGVFLKPLVLMIRLFANILSGHIVLLVFFCLIFVAGHSSQMVGYSVSIPTIAFTIFISLLEILVGVIQAFVFTFLSAIYFGMATQESTHH